MSINEETIKRVAFLSRINADDRLVKIKDEFEKVIEFLEEFDEIDVSKVEPMVSPMTGNVITRKDVVFQSESSEEVLANAKSEFGYFVVPKVME